MKTSYVSLLAIVIAGQAHAEDMAAVDAAAGDDVVVTASRSGDAIPLDLIGSSVTVIDDREMQDRQTRIVADVLRDVPGVAVNRNGAIGGLIDIRIRGAEANQTLVFIDGIKAENPYSGTYDFGTLLNDEASRIEVLRGQQSSLYGSDAIGGVITYTTLSGREKPGYSLRAEGGSMGTFSGGARAGGVVGDQFDYALTTSYYQTDGYPVAPGGKLDVGSDNLGASAKLNWTPAANFADRRRPLQPHPRRSQRSADRPHLADRAGLSGHHRDRHAGRHGAQSRLVRAGRGDVEPVRRRLDQRRHRCDHRQPA